MLQKLREKSSGWIATIILGLLCVPFAFFGMEQYLFQRNANFAAKIEAPPQWWPSAPSWWPVTMLWQREEIDADEFRTAFEQQRQQQRQIEGESFDPRAFESVENKRRVLEGMIDRRLMRMMADRNGIAVGDALVRETIQSVPAFQVGGKFDPQTYQLALVSQNQTPRQFEQVVRADLQQTIVPRGVAESAFVTKSEVDRLLKLIGETRSVSYVALPAPAPDAAPVADAEIQRWYQTHAAQYRVPESVTLEVVDVDAARLPPPAAPDEQALRQKYEQEQARFGTGEQRLVSHILIKPEGDDAAAQKAAEQKATDLATQARAPGADFAALARANSSDAGSKAGGGDLGWIEQNGAMVKPFEDAVFAMQPGEIRGPVKTDFGYHVIQVREVKPATRRPFEDVREELAAELAETGRERAFNELMGKLVDEVYKNPTTLAGAARAANLPVQTLGPVTRIPSPANAANPVLTNPAVLRAAFSETLIQDGTVSDPIEIAPGRSVLLRVKAHQPERALPLAQVRDRVIAAIRADRADKAARAAADALLKQVQGGTSLADAAKARGLEAIELGELERGRPVPDPAANEAIFNVPPPAAGKVSLGKAELADGRMAVFAVGKVTPADPAKSTPQQRTQLQEQLSQLTGAEDAQALVDALRRKTVITVAEDRL
jgi:peptidyl-prolyl cis-trans isomerase D